MFEKSGFFSKSKINYNELFFKQNVNKLKMIFCILNKDKHVQNEANIVKNFYIEIYLERKI